MPVLAVYFFLFLFLFFFFFLGAGGLQHVLGMVAGPEPIALDACLAVCNFVPSHAPVLLCMQVM